MLHKEIEVIHKIRNSKDPERALQIAMEIIRTHPDQRESCQEEPPDPQQNACEAI